jgi:hypothetical protein
LATPQEIAEIKGASKRRFSKLAFRLTQRLKPYYRRAVFSGTTVNHYDPAILKTPTDVYLQGYFQSERYFLEVQDVIRSEFTIRYEQDPQSQEIAVQIAETQSVSLHVRRGDYVSDATIRQIHHVCDLDYYQRCARLMAEQVTDPHFFVFTDDPDWVLENLCLDWPTTVVNHNGVERDYEDLRLMSACQHNIIANSSFSWWGAWLNAHPGKIVLAPQRWYNRPPNDDPRNLDTRDLLPDGWMRIAN